MANRLAGTTSPYLLQHAHNPVDWYPWGAEALDRAKKEERPILLSIGYAACHWCHVMERESFENDGIAKLMNERFVNIKVDREERPDLDHIYQLVVQLMGRSGGWPLTVFLTPDQRPFFAGTYFPPTDRHGMPGFPKILGAVADAYANKRPDVELQAQELTQAIARVHRLPSKGDFELGPDVLRRASRKLVARFDTRHGGFGARPKFPNTMALEVLLRRGVLEGDHIASDSAKLALDKMRAGGIWDHLRGGFHRYSTDERWLVPHFEKMLYDNALLLHLYVEGWRAFGSELYADTAREIVGYLFAEMRDPSGGFYSSQDADSEGVEGKFFVWTLADLEGALGDDRPAFDAARTYFGITKEGNFEETHATVLSEVQPIERVASILDVSIQEARDALGRAKVKMLAVREQRERPPRDDKVLASWNGLLIAALADAGRALDEPRWIDAAEQAFGLIESKLLDGGRVRRYLKDGKPAAGYGFLDDQGYVGCAALALYEATGDPRYVTVARAIADATLEHFVDDAEGGFYFTPDDGDSLIARTKDVFDQAIPSGAAMVARLLLRLGSLVDESYTAPAERHLLALAPAASEDAFALGQTTLVLDELAHGSVDVVLVGEAASDQMAALRRAVFRSYVPRRCLAVVDPRRPETREAAKLLAEGKPEGPETTVAFVCRGRTCSAPITDPAAIPALVRPEPS